MKKRSILNLIKYHAEQNESAFRNEAYSIAREFDADGDYQLADYIMAQMSDVQTFIPQDETPKFSTEYLREVSRSDAPLSLPVCISEEVKGVINAIGKHADLNKFLFQGPPGTGKTESVKKIAQILERNLLMVDFSSIIDSRLGQTSKNLVNLFEQLNMVPYPDQYIILFDELDALALNRADSNDLREMGRATSILLRELDSVRPQMVLIATTNLFEKLDRAMVRRFDFTVNFDRYAREDLAEIAEKLSNAYIDQYGGALRNNRLLNKIIKYSKSAPFPGELANIIKTAIAFSDAENNFDYLQRIYVSLNGASPSVDLLNKQGYTLREMEILTGIPKSTVARNLREGR